MHTVCPRTSDPFYIVRYYMNGSLLLGHVVQRLLILNLFSPINQITCTKILLLKKYDTLYDFLLKFWYNWNLEWMSYILAYRNPAEAWPWLSNPHPPRGIDHRYGTFFCNFYFLDPSPSEPLEFLPQICLTL